MKNCTNVNAEKVLSGAKVKLWSSRFFNYTETHISNNFSIAFFSLHIRLLCVVFWFSCALDYATTSAVFLYFCLFENFSIKTQKFIGWMNGKHRNICKLLLLQSSLGTTLTYWNKNSFVKRTLLRNWNRKRKKLRPFIKYQIPNLWSRCFRFIL